MKDGFQVCPNCSGKGCWHCERQGFVVRCPSCANSDHFDRQEDDFVCLVCGAVFGKAGDVHGYDSLETETKAPTTGKPPKPTKRKKLF